MRRVLAAAVLAACVIPAGARSDKGEAKLEVGMPAPERIKVGDKRLGDYRGKPLLVHVWATWCGPCMQSMPNFVRLAESYRKSDLQVLMLDRDHSEVTAHMYLVQHGISFTDVHGGSQLSGMLGDHGIPTTVLIDRDGVVRFNHVGEGITEKSEVRLKRAIDEALAAPVAAPAPPVAAPATTDTPPAGSGS